MRQRDLRQQLPAAHVFAVIRRAIRSEKCATARSHRDGAGQARRERGASERAKAALRWPAQTPSFRRRPRSWRAETPPSGADRNRRGGKPSEEPADSRGKRTAKGGSGAARQAKPARPFDPDSRFARLKDLKKRL